MIEAMQQALEALTTKKWFRIGLGEPNDPKVEAAITALSTAIEQAEKQEPVADGLIRGYINALVANKPDEAANATKRMVDYVFATPPAAPVQEPMPDDLIASYEKGFKDGAAQRQPLTDDRIGQIIEQCKITLVNYCSGEKQTEFARAIEAAHGIKKNT